MKKFIKPTVKSEKNTIKTKGIGCASCGSTSSVNACSLEGQYSVPVQ